MLYRRSSKFNIVLPVFIAFMCLQIGGCKPRSNLIDSRMTIYDVGVTVKRLSGTSSASFEITLTNNTRESLVFFNHPFTVFLAARDSSGHSENLCMDSRVDYKMPTLINLVVLQSKASISFVIEIDDVTYDKFRKEHVTVNIVEPRRLDIAFSGAQELVLRRDLMLLIHSSTSEDSFVLERE